MTLVDKAELTAALAERDAARAEVARLRAAVCVAGREFHDEWIEELCTLIPEDDMLLYSNPEGAVEAIILDCFRAYTAVLAATEDQP